MACRSYRGSSPALRPIRRCRLLHRACGVLSDANHVDHDVDNHYDNDRDDDNGDDIHDRKNSLDLDNHDNDDNGDHVDGTDPVRRPLPARLP